MPELIGTLNVGGSLLPYGVTVAGSNLWISTAGGDYLQRIDRNTGAVLEQRYGSSTYELYGLTWDGTNLWVIRYWPGANQYSLARADGPAGGSISWSNVHTLSAGSYQGLAWDGSAFWAARLPDAIDRIDPATGEVLRTIPFPGSSVRGLTWARGSLWGVNFGDRTLYQLDPDDGTVLSSFLSPDADEGFPAPWGLAWDDAAGVMWHSSYQQRVLYKLAGFNQPPNAPMLVTPTGGATIDRTVTQRFDWDFNDPDSGDTQSQYDLRYRIVGGSWTTVTGVTPNTYRDFDGGTFAAGDYEWQVRTYDAQGEVGPYPSSEFFTAATPPPGPTITAPTNGATVGLSEVLVEWSYPSQEAYRLQVLDGSGNTLTDTGQVNSTSARSYLVNLPTNNVTRTVRLQVLDGGLWSAWVAVTFDVSYTPPPAPVVSLLPDPDSGALVVTITNPASGAGEPATSYNDVFINDGAGEERRATEIGTNTSWTYWLPKAGRDYTSNIRVVAVGDNGTSSSS